MTAARPDNEAIFHDARDIPDPERRRMYIRDACGGDEGRFAHVEALLAAADGTDSLLDLPAAHTPGATIEQPTTERPGTVIGPYKLIEQLGEGGMGSVWMAQQNSPVKRLVAVKFIKAGMDSKQVIARFDAERQALALMDHPNIARVLDAGTTAAGRPYFVMELVKGILVTRYCDEHRLTPRERLELFVPVCQAVQHAHQKGIIHRDLKPSNVLIAQYDGRPVPKVIDFGVAKATGQQLTEHTLVTGFGAVVGTLEYMSPEQAELNQLDIDTRSDIYSLGVLLYELLTGTTPLEKKRLKEAGMLEALRLVREEEPPRPSTRLSSTAEMPSIAANRGLAPKRLAGLVRGELDWIVMKALEKDRTRRYETAYGVAQDIQRYLADETVLACPPSLVYRLRKFARRNKARVAVAALGLFFLASLGGVAGWAALRQVKQQAAQRAALETDIGRDLDEARDFCRQDRLREASAVLDHALALVTRGGADEDLGGRVAQLGNDVDMAARLEAIRLEMAAVKDEHFDRPGAALRYSEAFRDYGLDVDHLNPHEAAAGIEVSAVREQLVAALDDWLLSPGNGRNRLLAILAEADPDPWRQPVRTACVEGNAKAFLKLARGANASVQTPGNAVLMGHALRELGEIRLAAEFLRRAQQEHPSDFWLNQNLGLLLTHQKAARPGEAVGYLRVAVALRPDSPGALVNLGIALRADGDLPGASAAFQKAIDLKPNFATAHSNLGNALRERGDLPGAIAAYRQAIELKPDHARAHNNLGVALRDQGELPGAIAACQKAVALQPHSAEARNNLGVALGDQGDLAGGIAELRKAILLAPDLATAHSNLGNVLRERGDLPGAIAACQKAIDLKPDFAAAHNNLGAALRKRGDLPGAIAACRQAITLQPDFAGAYNNLGLALDDQSDVPGAIAACRKAIALKPAFAEAYNSLGIALGHQGDLPGAIAAFQKAIALKPRYAEAYGNLGNALRGHDDLPGAIAAFQKAIALQPKNADLHYDLGITLNAQGDLPGAVAAYQKAIALKPAFAEAHCNLGMVLQRQGQFAKALEELRRGHELGSRDPRWGYPSARWVRDGERLVALDGRWPDFLAGKAVPANPAERIDLARLCTRKQLNRAALRYYREAFAAQPTLLPPHSYDAACVAALAGCGRGQDADQLDDAERARLRRQALDWLSANLEARVRLLDKEPARVAAKVARDLRHWLGDPDFVGVRGPQSLAKLPEAERPAWQKFWKDVSDMLKQAQEKVASQKK
jgi:tetratricopeptide (TPR) repeat protein